MATILAMAVGMVPGAGFSAVPDEQFEAAFQALLADPSDNGKTLNFVRIAVEDGDYEAAAGALERLLLVSSDLSFVRHQVGLLYYRLGSYAMAQYHLQKALESGRLPKVTGERTARMLERLKVRLATNAFTGTVDLGMRFETNANNGPEGSTVKALGFDVILTDEFQQSADVSAFALGRLLYRHDLGSQNSAAAETDVLAYATRHVDKGDSDLIYFEVDQGLRFEPLPASLRGFTLRPYAVADIMVLDDELYSNAVGAGLGLRQEMDGDFRIGLLGGYRFRNYNSTTQRPHADGRDGHEISLGLNFRKLYRSRYFISGRLGWFKRLAESSFNKEDAYGFMVRGGLFHDGPFDLSTDFGRTYLKAGFRFAEFEEPNPAVDPSKRRTDRKVTVGAGTLIPVGEDLSIRLEASWINVDSSLPNYENENIKLSVSANWRF